ncbi:MAG TPA: hypothetical protein VEN79_14775 [Terriglobia bacterium]|nr:hypothetical protein [Terriglobia bacterium]
MFDKFSALAGRKSFLDLTYKPLIVVYQALDSLLHERLRVLTPVSRKTGQLSL